MNTPHARYEELVAGYALAALEPEDEQVLLAHLPACAACERELAAYTETLASLSASADDPAPPPALWEAIRREVEATSPGAFGSAGPTPSPVPAQAEQPAPVDLSAARARREERSRLRRPATWASVAAALVLVVGGFSVVQGLRGDSRADQLAAAVRAVETGPARTVPLKDAEGRVTAVAVVQADGMSLIVDGLARNDTADSVYVLWGQRGAGAAQAVATFDVTEDGRLDVVRDLPLPDVDGALPELLVLTKEPGRTPPAVTQQRALATGRLA